MVNLEVQQKNQHIEEFQRKEDLKKQVALITRHSTKTKKVTNTVEAYKHREVANPPPHGLEMANPC